jgi:hypothetical protein
VILISNMFGDILSNLAVALSGGLGLAAAINAGDKHAIANAGHGSAPDIAGKGIANPTGMILSAGMLLEWLGIRHGKPAFQQAYLAIQAAVDAALADANAVRTGDLGGKGNTNFLPRPWYVICAIPGYRWSRLSEWLLLLIDISINKNRGDRRMDLGISGHPRPRRGGGGAGLGPRQPFDHR